MIEEIAKRLKSINENYKFEGDELDFSNKNYSPEKFSENNFYNISIVNSDKKISFIDGGNIEIVKKPDLSVQLIRVYCTTYQNNKRIESEKYEYFCLTKISDGVFQSEIFSDNNEIVPDISDLSLRSDDITIKQGLARASVSKIGNIARLFSELILAKKVSSKVDYVVMDGTLQEQMTGHSKYLKPLLEVNVCAIAKSSQLVTKSGRSLESAFKKKGMWYYSPLVKAENSEVNMYVVKLHDRGKCFRFEVNGKISDELLSLLVVNSRDPVFFGYPYGLIEADTFARVTNQEKEYYSTLLYSKVGLFEEKGSHEILDSISY